MAKKQNADFRANPSASEGSLKVRADVCKCGATKCDYTATVTAAITAVNLAGDYDGHEVQLPAASYAVSSNGAAALETALKAELEGVVDDVDVTYNDLSTDTLVVTITGSLLEFKNLNGSANFTESNCRGTDAA